MSDVPLKEYIEQILAEREKAIGTATTSLEKRLELLNELRADVVNRGEYLRGHESLVERVRQVELSAVKNAVLVSMATSTVIGVIVGVIVHYLKP